jgi:hypothetical protein
MSKQIIITMGGEEQGWSRHNEEGIHRDYTAEAQRLIDSAIPYVSDYCVYDNNFIKSRPYYENHKDVLDKISFGFCYKQICFYETLLQIDYDDIVLMVDSNHVIQKNPQIFFDIAKDKGIFTWNHLRTNYINSEWTRRDTFVNMDCDEEKYWDAVHLQCNMIAICKTPIMMDFVREWLDKSLRYDIMFGNGKYPDFPDFKLHRHDQSIFSILVAKYNLPYSVRDNNIWMEFIIPEIDGITPEHIVDNTHRKEEDEKENK